MSTVPFPLDVSLYEAPAGHYHGTLTGEQVIIDEILPLGFSHLQQRDYQIQVTVFGAIFIRITYANGITADTRIDKASPISHFSPSHMTQNYVWSADKAEVPAVVIDIETEAQSVNSVITSMGLVYGDLSTGKVLRTDRFNVCTLEQGHRERDLSTLQFWQDQMVTNKIATDMMVSGPNQIASAPLKIAEVHARLTRFIHADPDAPVFGNGPEFDLSNLDSYLKHVKSDMPWHFRHANSMRTMILMSRKLLNFDPKRDPKIEGTYIKHFDIHDALFEFQYSSLIYQEFQKRLSAKV